MKKNKKGAAGTTTPQKNAKSTGQSTKSNKKEIKKNVPSDRELKYNYPKDCTTLEEKKEFRRKSRQVNRRYEKQLHALEEKGAKKQLREVREEYEGFKVETYTHPSK